MCACIRLSTMPPLKVTFDASTLTGAVTPDLCSNATDPASRSANWIVHAALKAGQIRGYFSEEVAALDLLGRDDKVEMVGDARVASETTTLTERPAMFSISVGTRWSVPPLHEKCVERLRAAQSLGMKALIGPRYLGNSLPSRSFGDDFYENYACAADLIAGSDRTHAVDAALRRRGLGRARVVQLGLDYSERDGARGEIWMQGIRRALNDSKSKAVHRAINEWADGDAVAAHVGYGNDLFCTNDFGRGDGEKSVLHPKNRAWLQSDYGLVFVTTLELAEHVGQFAQIAAQASPTVLISSGALPPSTANPA
jgi:hypothetical protein